MNNNTKNPNEVPAWYAPLPDRLVSKLVRETEERVAKRGKRKIKQAA